MFPGINSSPRTALLVTIWIVAVGLALRPLWKYEMTPGATAAAHPANWPAETPLTLKTDKPTLLLFAHPRCPCTRATVEELARLTACCAGRLHVDVFFYLPENADSNWHSSDLWASTARIPGVNIHGDLNGEEATRFGATISGSTILYSRAGQRIFAGGITSSRGHAGDNTGRHVIEEYVLNGNVLETNSFVFGCPILTTEQSEERTAY